MVEIKEHVRAHSKYMIKYNSSTYCMSHNNYIILISTSHNYFHVNQNTKNYICMSLHHSIFKSRLFSFHKFPSWNWRSCSQCSFDETWISFLQWKFCGQGPSVCAKCSYHFPQQVTHVCVLLFHLYRIHTPIPIPFRINAMISVKNKVFNYFLSHIQCQYFNINYHNFFGIFSQSSPTLHIKLVKVFKTPLVIVPM